MQAKSAVVKEHSIRSGRLTSGSGKDNQPTTKPTDYAKEIRITQVFLAFTTIAWLAVTWKTGEVLFERIQLGAMGSIFEQVLFIVIIQGLLYGNFVYQLTRLGYLRRILAHKPASPEEREAVYDGQTPSLAILVPSYKEELSVIRSTLMSAALQDFPNKRVVLLIDNPPVPGNPWDQRALDETRNLPHQLQSMFDTAAKPFIRAQASFYTRLKKKGSIDLANELNNLAFLYEEAAEWIGYFADICPIKDHADQLLHDKVFGRITQAHTERAAALRSLETGNVLELGRVQREYRRLAALFQVELSSFERKLYVNLSHESNKAMNLNSYINLLGRSWHTVTREDGQHLEATEAGENTWTVPAADFLITLDADSLLVPEYAIALVHEMRRPGNERMAVAQTPYNTVPNPTGELERVAGATTDIQYLIHQGFTYHNATYWVGANALLRTVALADIKQVVQERGFSVPVFIQDRTVIEDTESSVDLIACGWTLFNYPARLAFSATPPDFGSLLIQRRRWANGGLIILPKLLRHIFSRPFSLAKFKEGFFRIHYLGSIGVVNVGLLILLGHSFEHSIDGAWLPLTAVPYFALYARDLRYSGYKASDLISVYALNLLLIPVNLGGVFKSLQQAITGQRIPFGRTPKVSGRTAAPLLYVVAEYVLLASWILGTAMDVYFGRYISAGFCFVNALLLACAIKYYIGLSESWQDIRLGLPRWLTRTVQTPQRQLSDVSSVNNVVAPVRSRSYTSKG